jgi:hypothetical protein
LGIALTAGQAFSRGRLVEDIEIQVAPHMLLLSSVQSGEVTVHCDIPHSQVDTSSIEMNGVAVSWTKADDCGNLVAKFDEAAVKAVVEPPSTVLTLIGTTLDGTEFSGSDTVKVKP